MEMKNKKQIIRIVATIIAFLALMLVTLVPKFKEKNDRLTRINELKEIAILLDLNTKWPEKDTPYAYIGAGLTATPEMKDYPRIIEKPWQVKRPYYIALFSGQVTSSPGMPEVANCEEFIKYLSKGQSSPTWDKILENARAVDKACGK